MNEVKISENEFSHNKENTSQKQFILNYLNKVKNPFAMLSVEQIAKDLHIGINQAYELFEQEDFPSVNIGKRKKISLASYLFWKLNNKV